MRILDSTFHDENLRWQLGVERNKRRRERSKTERRGSIPVGMNKRRGKVHLLRQGRGAHASIGVRLLLEVYRARFRFSSQILPLFYHFLGLNVGSS